MIEKGFYIKQLKVTGLNKKPAILKFKPGFNLVTGLSDTGKSFAFACLNFMLGKSESPKSIPESQGYQNIYIELRTYSGKTYSLLRKISGGDYTLKECELDMFSDSKITFRILKVKPSNEKDNNISYFLLDLCGFKDISLKRSAKEKRNLTFNYIRKLTVIPEDRIITESSPFYASTQYADRTLFQSLLIYFLLKIDAKELEIIESEDIRKSRISGKIEFAKNRIDFLSKKIEELTTKSLLNNPKSIESEIESLKSISNSLTTETNALNEKKRLIFNDLNSIKSRILFKNELLIRLELLKEHYKSDLERLSFIDEGNDILNQLNTVNCPLCDGKLDSEKLIEIEKNLSVNESIVSESNKIKIKLSDLKDTIASNIKELALEKEKISNLENELTNLDKLVNEIFNPKLDTIKGKIDSLTVELTAKSKLEIYDSEVAYYYDEKSKLEAKLKIKPAKPASTTIDNSTIKPLLSQIKIFLSEWNYPGSNSIVFDSSYDNFDIVISQKSRKSFGKGMRAISYTSVLLGLLKYCLKENRNFSNLLILDSPLTTYHGKKPATDEDKINQDIQSAFFENLAKLSSDCQLIMFDNKVPSKEIIDKINYEYFTRSDVGRYGFFPIQSNTLSGHTSHHTT